MATKSKSSKFTCTIVHDSKSYSSYFGKRISLAYGQLEAMPQVIITTIAHQIQFLDLTCNNFSDLSFLTHFPELQTLVLDRNYNLDCSTLPTMEHLRTLSLASPALPTSPATTNNKHNIKINKNNNKHNNNNHTISHNNNNTNIHKYNNSNKKTQMAIYNIKIQVKIYVHMLRIFIEDVENECPGLSGQLNFLKRLFILTESGLCLPNIYYRILDITHYMTKYISKYI